MVAVISGNGLGLLNGSLSQIGQAPGSGSATIGQGKQASYVNAATGNLVLQSADSGLIFDGLAISQLRTYNSQGVLSGGYGLVERDVCCLCPLAVSSDISDEEWSLVVCYLTLSHATTGIALASWFRSLRENSVFQIRVRRLCALMNHSTPAFRQALPDGWPRPEPLSQRYPG